MTVFMERLFKTYREVQSKVLGHMYAASARRAQLANRFRKPNELSPGMHVLVRDARLRMSGGRGPHKEPLEAAEIVSVQGNKCTVRRREDKKLVENVHAENILVVPHNVQDYRSQS